MTKHRDTIEKGRSISGKGLFFVLSSGLVWAVAGIITKALFNVGTTPLPMILSRNTCGALCLGIFLFFYNRSLFKVAKEDIKTLLVCCLVMFVYSAAYFFSILYMNVSIAVVLLYLYPTIVAIASVFIFRERLTPKVITALALAVAGLLLTVNFFGEGLGRVSLPGLILGILAAFGAAGYCIYVKKLSDRYHAFTINFYCLLFTIAGYALLLPFGSGEGLTRMQFFAALAAALPYISGFLLYAHGVKFLRPSYASIFGTSELVFNEIFAAVFLGEIITGSQFVGSLLIVAAIVFLELPFFTKKSEGAEL